MLDLSAATAIQAHQHDYRAGLLARRARATLVVAMLAIIFGVIALLRK